MVDILATDYNSLQQRASRLLGTGSGTYGYGQSFVSTGVFQGNTITADQWDNLRNDITSIKIHQDGFTPTIRNIAVGDLIDDTSSDPKIQYANLLTDAETNRYKLASSQSLVTAIDSKTFTSAWSTSAEMTVTVNFSNANEARYFFNSGSTIRIEASRTGGSAVAQNSNWSNLLDSAGAQPFGADPDLNQFSDYYSLTTDYQTYFFDTGSTPYSANRYQLLAKCDVADNRTGTATEVTIKVLLEDSYVDTGPEVAPGDSVDGTLVIDVTEVKASGNLQPTGTFSITSPSFTLSNITAS